MLVLGSRNPLGNILHVVVGPESELHQDLHGAKILDITPVLAQMDGMSHVYLSLTRCRGEMMTAQILTGSKITHLNSFVKPTDVPTADANATAQPSVVGTREKCQYCGKLADLLPIDGFKVCPDCAAIELGRRLPKRK